MVVVVRDHHPGLVQRRRPAQLAARLARRLGGAVVRAAQGDAPRPVGLLDVDLEAALQLAHRGVADVAGRPRALLGSWRAAEVEDDALAQRAARRLQLGDAEVSSQRVEDAKAAGDDRAAVVLQPGQRERSALPASRQRSISQRRPSGVTRAVA
jgi:hypothetical protein